MMHDSAAVLHLGVINHVGQRSQSVCTRQSVSQQEHVTYDRSGHGRFTFKDQKGGHRACSLQQLSQTTPVSPNLKCEQEAKEKWNLVKSESQEQKIEIQTGQAQTEQNQTEQTTRPDEQETPTTVAAENVANVTRQDQTEEILTLKNEVQHLRQTEQENKKEDAVRMEYHSRREELKLEYWGMQIQEQKRKAKQDQELHDVAVNKARIEAAIREDEHKEQIAEKESLRKRFETDMHTW